MRGEDYRRGHPLLLARLRRHCERPGFGRGSGFGFRDSDFGFSFSGGCVSCLESGVSRFRPRISGLRFRVSCLPDVGVGHELERRLEDEARRDVRDALLHPRHLSNHTASGTTHTPNHFVSEDACQFCVSKTSTTHQTTPLQIRSTHQRH